MKILMCCHLPLKKELGGAKVYIECAESYRRLGAKVTLLGLEDLLKSNELELKLEDKMELYSKRISEYLNNTEEEFDVVEVEYFYYPFYLNESRPRCIVARSVLLEEHLLDYHLPHFKNLRGYLGKILKSKKRYRDLFKKLERGRRAFEMSDLVSVPNHSDKKILEKRGFDKNKVIVAPYGLNKERLDELAKVKKSFETKKIVFIGTFDNRKGAVEFPGIVQRISQSVPEAKFYFYGTGGMFKSKDDVISYFPKKLRKFVEVIEHFESSRLNLILEDSTLGIFPSHLESFGFGVLEMMAANLPVIAYDVPGPDFILDQDSLVKRGDWANFAAKSIDILTKKNLFESRSFYSAKRAGELTWDKANKETLESYKKFLNINN